jgi:hypothetical protein
MTNSWQTSTILFAAAALGGAVNSVAGGGTLLTFPSLLWAGLSERVANATSTVALWPGALSSLWGYRSEVASSPGEMALLTVPSLLGGIVGAVLLVWTDNATFAALVPYLILLATFLFMVQEPLTRWMRRRAEPAAAAGGAPSGAPSELFPAHRWAAVVGYQFLVAIYGGYFGAGIGILMLAAFGFLGMRNIYHMNGLKNLCGMAINGIAALWFILQGLVDWRLALLMAAGAILGGYAGAGVAQRIGQRNVRRLIVLVGLSLTAGLLVRR